MPPKKKPIATKKPAAPADDFTPPKKAKKPRTEKVLDPVVPYLRGKGGAEHVLVVIREVINAPDGNDASAQQLDAALRCFKDDERFTLKGQGFEAICSLVEVGSAEPPELNAANTAPAPTPAVEQTPTLAEVLAKSEQEDAAKAAAAAKAPKPADPTAEHNRLEEIAAASKQYEDDLSFEILKKADAKRATSARKASHEHLLEVLGGQGTILKKDGTVPKVESAPAKMKTGRKPQDAPAPAAASKASVESAPMVDIRAQGAKAAIAGIPEDACPIDAENNPAGVAMWLDGYREQMRVQDGEHPALTQAIYASALADAQVDGFLPRGEVPSVKTVSAFGRDNIVVGSFAVNDQATGTYKHTRWHCVPLYSREDWNDLHAKEFGPAIEAADANDEAKATREAGGIDCGRTVKVGRKKLIVGSRRELFILTTKEGDEPAKKPRAKAAKASA